MDFCLSDTQQMYVDTVQRFVKTDILPQIMDLERKHAFPGTLIHKAWEMGILNLCIPESIKGYGIDVISSALIIKELSYGDTGIATSAMCNDLANAVIAMHGTGRQQTLFLKPFVDAPKMASFCLTEPGAGSDNSAMTTFIKKSDDGDLSLERGQVFHYQCDVRLTVYCFVQGWQAFRKFHGLCDCPGRWAVTG